MKPMREVTMLVAVAILAGCGGEKPVAKKPLTERERNEAIGASSLPGAAGVRGALRVQDSAQARNNRLDTIQ